MKQGVKSVVLTRLEHYLAYHGRSLHQMNALNKYHCKYEHYLED
jgi:hypothetical protein